jgi:hypothetical protein
MGGEVENRPDGFFSLVFLNAAAGMTMAKQENLQHKRIVSSL